MKQRLTKRLILYFSVTLVLFALLMGSLFSWLFTHYNQHAHEEETMQRAVTLAAAIPAMNGSSQLLDTTEPVENEESRRETMMQRHGHHGMMGHRMESMGGSQPMGHGWCRQQYSIQDSTPEGASATQAGMFLQQLDHLAQGKVWLVSSSNRTIHAYGENTGQENGELPAPVEDVLAKVLAGDTAVSHDFGALIDTPSVTAGAPITSPEGVVMGAVLIHRPMKDLQDTINGGLRMLAISVLLAMMLAGSLAVLLARRFIRPLYRMQRVSRAFAQGNFAERTGIRQQDEIGMLAADIDVLGGQLARAEKERAASERQRQDFLSAVSHELRTPLTVLRGTMELLFSGIVTEASARQNYIRQVMTNLSALERLVGDLLELTRLQNPGFSIEQAPLDLQEAFGEAAEHMETAAKAKGISLQTDFQEPIPVIGDYGRLRQLMMILLDNGVKFSEAGGEILLQSRIQADTWQVLVKDHGCGIAPEELPHIFERFHTNREHNQQGTGLGLAIAREIAARHGMNLVCESRIGQGTTFLLTGRILKEAL